MATDKKELLKTVLEGFASSGMEVEDKLRAFGPLLALCDRDLSEQEFRLWLDIYDIPVVDPVVERMVKDYLNLLHYSGLINLHDPLEDTWLDVDNANTFMAVTDEEFAKFVDDINEDILAFQAYFA